MAKVAFTKLGLKPNIEVKTFTYNDQEIEVKQYLPIQEKLELVGDVVNSVLATDSNKFSNLMKLNMFLSLHIVFKYTNVTFTEKQKEDLPKLYDLMQCNGLIPKVIANMEESEYHMLLDYMERIREDRLKYKQTAAAVLQSIISDLPANAEAAAQIVDNFNPEQYQNVVDFARAANGGRDI